MIKYETILDLIQHSQIDAAGELLRRMFLNNPALIDIWIKREIGLR